MPDVRSLLEEALGDFMPSSDDPEVAVRRAWRRQRNRRIGAALLSLAVFVAGATFAWLAFVGVGPRRPPATVAPSEGTGCATSQLTLAWGGSVSEATGQHSLLLTLTNTSASPCDLDGYPGIVLADATGAPIPFVYRDGGDQMVTSQPPALVTLAPGRTAYLMANKYRCDTGSQTRAVTVSVTPPGSATALSLSWGPDPTIDYCGPGDPGSVVNTSPIEPTAQAVFAAP